MSRVEVAVKLRDQLMEQFLTEGDCHSDDVYYYEMIMDSLTDTELIAYESIANLILN